ncbi:MAG TPA: prenyltransferase/squalene oxidase repeat-containing protein [Planctomycetota bacterium]|jgi:squalene-hopene/tetraprenyl-beta-curcumene cyclase
MLRKLVPILCVLFAATAWAGEASADATAGAAKKSVEFLLKQQNDDGTFGKSQGAPMPGMVGMVLKALASSPDKLRETNPVIERAVKYILAKQQADGSIALPQFGLENYNTSVAAIGLAALENPAHKAALEKAKKFILSCQLVEEQGYNAKEHPRAYGGFGYGNSKRSDVSNTGFSLEALKAMGLEENSPAWKNAVLFIKRSQDNDETNDYAEMQGGNGGGGFVYLPGDGEFGTYTSRTGKKLPKPYGNMTYQAVKSLIYAKVSLDDPALKAAFKWISNNYSVAENPGGVGSQGYFYYVNAFAKAFTAAGTKEITLADGRKVHWAKDLASQLISMQKPDGSFVNPDKRWMEDDAVLSTAYALDALNLCIAGMK